MKKNELLKSITKSLEEQKEIIENTHSMSFAARKILGTDSTLARKIIKEICNENGWNIPQYYDRVNYCLNCNNKIKSKNNRAKFCSHSCSAQFNNKLKNNSSAFCLHCGLEINKKYKFCNNKCSANYKENQYIQNWKSGKENGNMGAFGISEHIRHYLFIKNNNKCECCGWSIINKYTNKIPLHIHHIDGNCMNNKEENLQLLCPNCHSLTENFGSRNKNASRIDTRKRY